MKLKKRLRKSLELNLWSKILIGYFVVALPFVSLAQPIINDTPLPPASFTFIEDKSILEDIGLTPGPAWCYNTQANAIIITAPARERARCDLKLMYETEKHKVKYEFKISNLELRIKTLTDQYDGVIAIKDKEIEKLTEAVLKRPNDNNVWWAAGGVVTGVIVTVLVGWAITSANSSTSI